MAGFPSNAIPCSGRESWVRFLSVKRSRIVKIGALFALVPWLVLVSACEEEVQPDLDAVARTVLRGVPIVPLSTVLSSSGTESAMQSRMFTPFDTDSVATWYRRELTARGWQIVGDMKSADGSINLHASRDGPPLWIILRPYEGRPGTEYTIIGAVLDTAQVVSSAAPGR